MIPKFKGKVQKGRVVLEEPEVYDLWVSGLEGEKVETIVRKETKERTDKQNKYYWSVVVKLISDSTGYTPEETHELLKSIFLKDHKVVKNKRYTVVKSTTQLTTKEFVEFIDKVKMWSAQEVGVVIPDADAIDL